MALLVSSEDDLLKLVSRDEAPELFEYVGMGGILRIERTGDRLSVIYPTKKMIKERIKELREKERTIIMEMSKIRRIKEKRRLLDPLRIKHALLSIFDKEYRDIAEKIEAERLLEDERGRKIVEQLQKDKEYRERLREALEESPVYRNRKFGEFVEKYEEVKGKLLGERLKRLEESLERTRKEIGVLEKLLRWVKG